MITFWGALLLDLRRWKSSTFDRSMSALTFLSKLRGFPSRALFSILLGIPGIFRHFLREYCSFSWHLRSRVFIYFVKLSLTFLLTCSSDSKTLNFDFNSLTSYLSDCQTEVNLPWSSNTNLTNSSFDNFTRECSMWSNFINFQRKKFQILSYHNNNTISLTKST